MRLSPSGIRHAHGGNSKINFKEVKFDESTHQMVGLWDNFGGSLPKIPGWDVVGDEYCVLCVVIEWFCLCQEAVCVW